ncbi:MAG TPA: MerR family transcriptional regulator [Roseiarcus sp.]|jgi:DNA-binding transcriptional MerR regulator|nr:MerR family transcriptional regulator [Roseiarcus sp.]
MEKSPEAFRTIREVAEAMALPQHVLRFWETRFPQIKPLKRAGGRRYYRPEDVERLKLIKRLLYDEGYTIKGVQKLFKEQGVHNLAIAAVAGRLSSSPAEAEAPEEGREFSVLDPDGAAGAPEPPPEFATAEAPSPPAPRLTPEELTELRGVLADIREAQRILDHAHLRQG